MSTCRPFEKVTINIVLAAYYGIVCATINFKLGKASANMRMQSI